MKIIKLDAVNSTNSFLKQLAQEDALESGATVVAKTQWKGKGQMGKQWVSEDSKNLLCSVFFSFENLLNSQQIYLNYAVSLAVFEVLKSFHLPKLTIKWPNDILSENKKVAGILIENTLQGAVIKSAVVGVGINANQSVFPAHVKHASSIQNITNQRVDLEDLLLQFRKALLKNIALLKAEKFAALEAAYLAVLYKKNTPTMFKNCRTEVLFMGAIQGVSPSGKLQIQLADESLKEFGIKEVAMATQL